MRGTYALNCVVAWVAAGSPTSWNDRGALKMLYWATGGPSWNVGWPITSSATDPCLNGWYGVHCNTKGQIISLTLGNNNLRGYLPAAFARLTAIQILDVSGNYLTDTVPLTLGDLKSLKTLRLDHNAFTGTVPASLATLPHLMTLYVVYCLYVSTVPNPTVRTLEVNQFAAPLPLSIYTMQNTPNFFVSFDGSLMPTAFDPQ
ncbi:Aste57867_3531 [Aphanomyces stellatus]|uniref:Aste57867_3531 protein n=1 Tax=Aphanomyces stellatus TaxID=120398 RepID=A0A485K9W0_9STRA|nr:hypothetical protein As57867_003520 [Aphanomyces stellatus]VFT80694.1 Aste57867_3531 [Aphanomyces stellatus]